MPDVFEPRNAAALRKRTAEVMIRHRRSDVSVLLPQRLAETLRVEPSGAEREWYSDLTTRVRAEGKTSGPARRLTLRSVAKLAGSSPAAAAPTLAKIGWDDPAARAGALAAPAKIAVLLDQLAHEQLLSAQAPGPLAAAVSRLVACRAGGRATFAQAAPRFRTPPNAAHDIRVPRVGIAN